MRARWSQLRRWPAIRWVVALAAGIVTLVVIGIPTVMIANPFFTRMTPTAGWEYPIWIVSSVLAGLMVATFVRADPHVSSAGLGRTASGGLLSAFAIGCPVCNKFVVTLIGVSGALQVWAPLQPLLGAVSVALLAVAFRRRLDGEVSCATSSSSELGVGTADRLHLAVESTDDHHGQRLSRR